MLYIFLLSCYTYPMSFSEEISIHSIVDSVYDTTDSFLWQTHFPLEIVYCTDGALQIDFVNSKGRNDNAVLTARQFLLIRPNVKHILRILQKTKLYVLELSHNNKDDILHYIRNCHFAQQLPTLRKVCAAIDDVTVLTDESCVGQTLKELIALSYRLRKTETDEFYRYDYDVLLKKLFIEISRNAAGKQKAHGNKYIVLATNYIYNNYNKPLSLDSVASFTGVTPRYLQSLFKQTYNQTIIAKLTEYRLQKACELLKQTDYGIAHIAQTVGYNNFRAFLAAFTKHIGTTPSAYRKQNRVDCFIYDFGSNSTTGNVVVWERHDP